MRLATHDDLMDWWGNVPATMRALVVEDGGRILGVAGLAVMPDHIQAFSRFKDELRAHPFVLAKVAVLFKALLDDAGGAVMAVCSETEPTAPSLLRKLGFRHFAGGVWRHG